jgi:hypothetical protein
MRHLLMGSDRVLRNLASGSTALVEGPSRNLGDLIRRIGGPIHLLVRLKIFHCSSPLHCSNSLRRNNGIRPKEFLATA